MKSVSGHLKLQLSHQSHIWSAVIFAFSFCACNLYLPHCILVSIVFRDDLFFFFFFFFFDLVLFSTFKVSCSGIFLRTRAVLARWLRLPKVFPYHFFFVQIVLFFSFFWFSFVPFLRSYKTWKFGSFFFQNFIENDHGQFWTKRQNLSADEGESIYLLKVQFLLGIWPKSTSHDSEIFKKTKNNHDYNHGSLVCPIIQVSCTM